MKTYIKTLAFAIATAAFTACSAPTIDPVRPTQPAASIILPIKPSQPQPIAETLDDEQPANGSHGKPVYGNVSAPSSEQPAIGNTADSQPSPRPTDQKPARKPAQFTAVSDSLM